MVPFITGPMNPYLFIATALSLVGVSYFSFDLLFRHRNSTGPVYVKMTTVKPVIVQTDQGDSIKLVIPKALIPEEDSLVRTIPDIPTVDYSNITEPPIPQTFDARKKWPKCADVIGKVWDQGSCQSCWAISAASVMTDRLCIKSDATSKPILSPQHLICSCKNCTRGNAGFPVMPQCNGGDSEEAWEYWLQEGLVTGGDYGTKDSCLPYLAKPCLHNPAIPPTAGLLACPALPETYACPDTCVQSGKKMYEEQTYKGSRIYYVNNRTEDIQRDILLNGPVQAKFMFEDRSLRDFKGEDIYAAPEGSVPPHLHSIKIIGWNFTEKGEDYWLCVNSFGVLWGDQGLFRLKRGLNLYRIEESVMAGIPEWPFAAEATALTATP